MEYGKFWTEVVRIIIIPCIRIQKLSSSDELPPDVNSQLMYQHEFPDKDDIAGFTRSAPPPAFVPKYCVLDKKVLRFFGHFQETIPDGMGTESTRVRNVHLLYYLEDDTLSLVEPRLHNSGLDQGILIKRHRIPKNNPFQVYQYQFDQEETIESSV